MKRPSGAVPLLCCYKLVFQKKTHNVGVRTIRKGKWLGTRVSMMADCVLYKNTRTGWKRRKFAISVDHKGQRFKLTTRLAALSKSPVAAHRLYAWAALVAQKKSAPTVAGWRAFCKAGLTVDHARGKWWLCAASGKMRLLTRSQNSAAPKLDRKPGTRKP